MVRKGGCELLHHIDNKQLIDSTSGLKAKYPTIPIPLYVYLLYGERAEEETAPKALSLNPASNSLTSAPPSVKATDRQATDRECREWSACFEAGSGSRS